MEMSFSVTGLKELTRVLEELADEFGDKKVNSKILVPAVREAMQPVLRQAQAAAPMDTGGLKLSLQVEARRPSRRDRRSKYIMSTDTVIAAVTTASGKKLAKMSEGAGLVQARKRLSKLDTDAHVGAYQAQKFMGVESDARAIAQEFGTSHNGAQPFLRPSLESNSQAVAKSLGDILARRIEKFKATPPTKRK
jgi:HK97 gp10 family phage protein